MPVVIGVAMLFWGAWAMFLTNTVQKGNQEKQQTQQEVQK